ncbi:MAG: ABC transporter permease [Sphaerobacter sp.]|nr:ABC transporter permease [Sphaerobacter sp.]
MASRSSALASATARERGFAGRGPGMGTLIGMELAKLRKRPMTRVVFGLLVLAAAGLPVLIYAAGTPEARDSFVFPGAIEDGVRVAELLGMVSLPVLGAAIAGSEYAWGTMRLLIATGVGRGRLFTAKLVALLLATLAHVVLAVGLVSLEAAVAGALTGRGHELPTIDAAWVGDLVQMLGTTWFLLSFLVLVGFGVAMLGRSMAAGIAVAIGLPIAQQIGSVLAPAILGRFGEVLVDFFPNTSFEALAQRAGFDAAPPDGLLSPERAVATLLAYTVILLGAALLVFQRRDVPSGD